MPRHHLLRLLPVSRLLDAPDVQRAVLPVEATHAAHVVAVVRDLSRAKQSFELSGMLPAPVGQCVAVFALPAVWAAAAREEEADVLHPRRIRAGEPRVALDLATASATSLC